MRTSTRVRDGRKRIYGAVRTANGWRSTRTADVEGRSLTSTGEMRSAARPVRKASPTTEFRRHVNAAREAVAAGNFRAVERVKARLAEAPEVIEPQQSKCDEQRRRLVAAAQLRLLAGVLR